jgi:hypothetical protein
MAQPIPGGVPPAIETDVRKRLPEHFLATIDAFYARFIKRTPCPPLSQLEPASIIPLTPSMLGFVSPEPSNGY